MKYELEDLETMVLALLKNDRELFDIYAKSLFSDDKTMVSIYKRICTAFMKAISEDEPEMLQDYFYQHQKSLVLLADKIYAILNFQHESIIASALTDEEVWILEYLAADLENILYFMKTNLLAYFKFKGKVPDNFLKRHKHQQANDHLFIECSLLLRGVHGTMVTHLISIFKFEDRHPGDEISFAQYDYVLNAQKELLGYLKDKHNHHNNHSIMKLLITFNLNSMKRIWELN